LIEKTAGRWLRRVAAIDNSSTQQSQVALRLLDIHQMI